MRRIEPPSQADDSEALLDYLELYALVHGRAQVRGAIDDKRIQTDPGHDMIDQNTTDDAVMLEIEQLVDVRARCSGILYPFGLSDRGDEVIYLIAADANPTDGQQAYLACLLISAFRRLAGGWDSELHLLNVQMHQRVFQLLATISLAGLSRYSAITIGAPRRSDEEILVALARGYERGSGVQPLLQPSAIARPMDKDGGVDALGWTARSPTAALPDAVWWAQVASGRNWQGKAVVQDAGYFRQAYVASSGLNHNYVTIIPFSRLSEPLNPYNDFMHGKVLDRSELPTLFEAGLTLAESGIPIDEIEHLSELSDWNAAMVAEIT